MKEPDYKIGEVVRYELEDGTAGFGTIAGGLYTENTWHYNVVGPSINGNGTNVTESAIKFTMENNNWAAPTNFTGGNSAYADPGTAA